LPDERHSLGEVLRLSRVRPDVPADRCEAPLSDGALLIGAACAAGDYRAFGVLVSEYVDWCRQRYAHDVWFVEQVFGYQELEQELRQLAAIYGPPEGVTLLARLDGGICGGGAWRRLADGSCELKRMYVADRCRGRGIGRALGAALVESARTAGHRLMRLDTGNRLFEAIALYRKLGFHECAAHRTYPLALLPYLLFMELPLADPP
jgi:GNAT superfamily N-acetyltransferase